MRSDGQLCCSLIRPLLPEFRNAHTTVVKDFMCNGSLFTYSLLEVAPEPITELSLYFITNRGSMAVEKPDAALALSNDQRVVAFTCYEMNLQKRPVQCRSA